MFKSLRPNKVIKNSGFFLASEVIKQLFFLILVVLISKVFGVEGVGAYGFIFAFTGIMFSFSGLGQPVFIRDLITCKESIHKFWGNLLALKFFTSLIIYGVIFLITLTEFIPQELKSPIRLAGFILLGGIFSESAEVIFVAYQKIKPFALISTAGDLLTISLSIFCILLGKGLSWVVISFAIGELFKAVILNFLLIKIFSKPDLEIDLKLCVDWVKKGIYFIMQKLFRQGSFQADILIISLMSNLYFVGLYQAPYKIVLGLNFVPALFTRVFYPYYTDVNQFSFESLKIYYTKYKKYILIISLLLGLFLFIFSKQIIFLLYGKEFLNSVLILKILAISIFLFGPNSNNAVFLNAIKKEKKIFYITLSTFLLNILLDISLIKVYGIIGVAFSTVICSIAFFVVTECYIRKLTQESVRT